MPQSGRKKKDHVQMDRGDGGTSLHLSVHLSQGSIVSKWLNVR